MKAYLAYDFESLERLAADKIHQLQFVKYLSLF